MKAEALLFPPPLYSSFISVAMHHLEKVASSMDVGEEGEKEELMQYLQKSM